MQQIEDGEIEKGRYCLNDNFPKLKYLDCEESFGKLNLT